MLQAAELVAAAHRAAGLAQSGGPPFHLLEAFVASITAEAQLTKAGWAARRRHIERLLVNNIRLTTLQERQPEIFAAEMPPPLVIVGMPRSGTTKLHRLLSRDASFNVVSTWENLFPIPLSDSPSDREMRRQIGIMFAKGLRTNSPDIYAVHPIDAEEPEEEIWLMQHSFLTESVEAELRVPTYLEYLKAQDVRPMYDQLGLWLLALSAQGTRPALPWLLKGTFHTAHLDVLLETFPQAKLVYCYRDPLQAVPSYMSLVEKLRRQQSDHVDLQELGRTILTSFSRQQAKGKAHRRNRSSAILEVAYRDIVARPLDVVRQIYEFAGLQASEATLSDMRAWNDANPQYLHGQHAYLPEKYGLSANDIEAACHDYRSERPAEA